MNVNFNNAATVETAERDVLTGNIPLRIIKTGQGEPCEISGLLALSAKEMRTEKTLFSQVKVTSGICLRTERKIFKNLTMQLMRTQRIFAKRNFGDSRAQSKGVSVVIFQ